LRLVVDDLVDISDDIKKGIHEVEKARKLLTKSRQKVGKLRYSPKLREQLLRLIDDQRDYLSRKLQYFLNMVLIPNEKIGLGKTKVILVFNSPFMRDRKFTVSATPKERRNFTKSSTVSVRTLSTKATQITESMSSILDFTEALE
jgi:hypothetical protein